MGGYKVRFLQDEGKLLLQGFRSISTASGLQILDSRAGLWDDRV
ncbi:hypothetical protein [Microcoleus sp. B9-D4]